MKRPREKSNSRLRSLEERCKRKSLPRPLTLKNKLKPSMMLETVTGGITSGVTAVKPKMKETENVLRNSGSNSKQTSIHTIKCRASSDISINLFVLPKLSNLKLMVNGTIQRT